LIIEHSISEDGRVGTPSWRAHQRTSIGETT